MSAGLEVSLSINGEPTVGEEIALCVTVTNYSSGSRVLMEHLSAQVKGYNSSPQESFWKTHKEVHIKPGQGEEPCIFMMHNKVQCLALLYMINTVFHFQYNLFSWLGDRQLYYCLTHKTSTEPYNEH